MLSKETQERIGQDADKHAFVVPFDGSHNFYDNKLHEGYITGATAEAARAQILEEALEFIVNNHVIGGDIGLRAHCAAALNKYRNAP